MEKKQVSINFGLKFVEITEIIFNANNIDPNKNDISYKIGTYIEANNTSKCMIIIPTVRAFETETEDKEIFKLSVRHEFIVENFDEFLNNEEDVLKIRLPIEFIANLLSIAISTTRGILIEKLAGTSLRNFFLPIHNPFDIIKPIAETLANLPVD